MCAAWLVAHFLQKVITLSTKKMCGMKKKCVVFPVNLGVKAKKNV
jgi:hypothetical protein